MINNVNSFQVSDIKLFESKKVRTHWDEEKELLYFSVIDVIEALTGTDRPRKYWNDLKTKLKKEGSELSEKIGQLKMMSSDGNLELVLNMLAEATTTEISKEKKPRTLDENKVIAMPGRIWKSRSA